MGREDRGKVWIWGYQGYVNSIVLNIFYRLVEDF